MTGYRDGLIAEAVAAWMLRFKGYRILAMRYKTPVGEIDVMARRGGTLVFVEVKARSSMDEALHAVRAQQAKRIIRAAEYYLASGKAVDFREMRFDVIAIRLPFQVQHIKAAFTA